jgi:hypothetical protein
MFLRTVTKGNGKQYHYVLRSVRKSGRAHPAHEIVADLTALPAAVVDVVRGMLKGSAVRVVAEAVGVVRVKATLVFAPLWIALHFWLDLGIRRLPFLSEEDFVNLTGMVLARTVSPVECRSETRTAEWLRKSALHLILGGNLRQWDRNAFYPILGKLSEHWEELEDHLWRQRTAVPRLYLYDITSTYFEGQGGSFAALGHSRDERPGNPQVVIALVADEQGLPIAMRILPGNTKDASTVAAAVSDLKRRFGVANTVAIMDRGMRGEANTAALKEAQLDYIMALPHKQAREFLIARSDRLQWELFDERHLAEWIEDGKRYVLCRNPNSAARDHRTRDRIVGRAARRLESLKTMAEKGRIKDRDRILARAVRILTQTKAAKYYTYEVGTGSFRYETTELVKMMELYEGCYVLETTLLEQPAKTQIDQTYRNQREIEEVFKSCKDELHLRPNFHKKDENILGHIRLTFLAHLVKKRLELKLRTAACTDRGSTFLARFSDIAVNEVEVAGEAQPVITELSPQQRRNADLAGVRIPQGPFAGTLRKVLPKSLQHLI